MSLMFSQKSYIADVRLSSKYVEEEFNNVFKKISSNIDIFSNLNI